MGKKSAADVLDRLQIALGVTNDSQLCERTGTNRQTMGNWRSRSSVPYSLCVDIAEEYGVSLDWLLTGTGSIHRAGEEISLGEAGKGSREKAFLSVFRALGEDDQRDVQRVAEERKRVRDIEQRVAELTAALADINRPA